jgi:hypothetical protein
MTLFSGSIPVASSTAFREQGGRRAVKGLAEVPGNRERVALGDEMRRT